MFIQGDLQTLFDALFTMGVIDPMLKMDWSPLHAKMQKNPERLHQALAVINGCGNDLGTMIETIRTLDGEIVNFVALEVARELAEFTERKTLH